MTKSAFIRLSLSFLLLGLLGLGTSAEDVPPQKAPPQDATPPAQPAPLDAGNHTRSLMMGTRKRTYLVHVPPGYDPQKPTPVVLALHGAAMSGPMMVWFTGLNKTADKAGFIVVYPTGTGTGPLLVWNAGGFTSQLADGRQDDVAFISKLLDDLGTVVKMDEKRVYACGLSNGAMMCYRLAAELSDRIAAIAPVAGLITIDESKPKRPVPVLHIHGLDDHIVPYERKQGKTLPFMKLRGVEESVQTWVKLNECEETPTTDTLTKAGDEMPVTRRTYGGGRDGSEVILIVIEKGGHTWPGQQPPVSFIGRSTKNISANDLIWEFFEKHPMK